jgi:hypothetical protein
MIVAAGPISAAAVVRTFHDQFGYLFSLLGQ